jgi:hypothetical protein
VVIGLLLCAGRAIAAEPFGPWSVEPTSPVFPAPQAVPRPAEIPGRSASPFGLAFWLWSAALTRVDGPRCAHRPSCAAYAERALAGHGPVPGGWMAIARLLRGARSSALRPLALAWFPDGMYFVDPLEDSELWDYRPMSGR